MEVNIWTSSTVVSALPDADNKWTVKVQRSSGEERVFKVNHVVLATGFAGGTGNVPHYPGMVRRIYAHSTFAYTSLG